MCEAVVGSVVRSLKSVAVAHSRGAQYRALHSSVSHSRLSAAAAQAGPSPPPPTHRVCPHITSTSSSPGRQGTRVKNIQKY